MSMTLLHHWVRVQVAHRRARDPMVTVDDMMPALVAAQGARFGEAAVRDAVLRVSLAPAYPGCPDFHGSSSIPGAQLFGCRLVETPLWLHARGPILVLRLDRQVTPCSVTRLLQDKPGAARRDGLAAVPGATP